MRFPNRCILCSFVPIANLSFFPISCLSLFTRFVIISYPSTKSNNNNTILSCCCCVVIIDVIDVSFHHHRIGVYIIKDMLFIVLFLIAIELAISLSLLSSLLVLFDQSIATINVAMFCLVISGVSLY